MEWEFSKGGHRLYPDSDKRVYVASVYRQFSETGDYIVRGHWLFLEGWEDSPRHHTLEEAKAAAELAYLTRVLAHRAVKL